MPYQPTMLGTRYMVAAGHYLAAQAGFNILEDGGNAIDAGVASAMTLAVVQSDIVNVGGVAPMILYLAETNEVVTISGLGWWPKKAELDLFIREHNGTVPAGVRRSVIPAAPDAWLTALLRYGTKSFGEVAEGAIRCAREGFSMHETMAGTIESAKDGYANYPSNMAIMMPNGRVPEVGENFVQSDLARSLQYMVDEESSAASASGREAGLKAARAAFYEGDIAKAIAKFHREEGGLITEEDLREFHVAIEDPVKRTYWGIDVYTCGPWCQGPSLLQMMALVEGYDLKKMGHNSADYIHTVSEAIKLVFADRERYYADPRFVDVPLDILLSDAYSAERRKMIRSDEAWPEMPAHGAIDGFAPGGPSYSTALHAPAYMQHDTSYACAIDSHGNAFSVTPSDSCGASPLIPGLGLVASGRGSQNWAVEGHPCAIAPGKRPRLTPNPALAMIDGKMTMPFGTPGGDVQCQAMLQVFLNIHQFGLDPQEAIEAPRFSTFSHPSSFEPHQAEPGVLRLENRIDAGAGEDLAAKGHTVEWWPELTRKAGSVCAIVQDRETGRIAGGADARRQSRAIGW
ncbi:MAG: gamma-glutamyltransferase family protein [Alphaproteobacteria bacterium]|nr:gamma-glutamyltransferase family protein [Alphaproteobacteria bacterium]